MTAPNMLDAIASPRLQPLRLASGLTMFSFALLHFANHAVGLIGLNAMNAVQDWRLSITHSTPVRLVLLAAILTHITLGLGKLAARRTLRMPPMELLQIASGILIPVLLIP
ncbi:MAG: adenylate/guanylate cyclase domain-containing protein, partial [Hyphomicrobiaceae bacterium]